MGLEQKQSKEVLIRDFNQEIKPRAALQVINWRVAVQTEIVTAFTTLMYLL